MASSSSSWKTSWNPIMKRARAISDRSPVSRLAASEARANPTLSSVTT
jgi:hypothetical protein